MPAREEQRRRAREWAAEQGELNAARRAREQALLAAIRRRSAVNQHAVARRKSIEQQRKAARVWWAQQQGRGLGAASGPEQEAEARAEDINAGEFYRRQLQLQGTTAPRVHEHLSSERPST